jgi:MFS family permease
MLGLGFGLSMLGSGSFVFFRIPYYVDAGIRPELVGLAAATDALMVVLGTFVLGIWIDKLSLRHGGALGILLVTIALVIAVSAVNPFSMFLSNFVFGLGQIFNTNVRNVIWPAYFGRANIGSIRGTAFTVQMVFGAIGAPLVGLVRDLTGSYQIAWVMMLAPMMIATVMIFLAVKPQPTGVSATAPSTS